jgi:hypothetical protein
MKLKNSLIAALALVLAVPSIATGKDKKGQTGMLESMQAVPCGAKERGLTGLGALYGSIGVAHVNSDEKLCPQYLLRTDAMDYHIRPLDAKHAVVLPVGHEAQFKIKDDRLLLKVPDGDKDVRKEHPYQVVSMQPPNSDAKAESGAYRAPDKPVVSPAPTNPPVDKASSQPTGNPPPN